MCDVFFEFLLMMTAEQLLFLYLLCPLFLFLIYMAALKFLSFSSNG